jgi:hypothetical protein
MAHQITAYNRNGAAICTWEDNGSTIPARLMGAPKDLPAIEGFSVDGIGIIRVVRNSRQTLSGFRGMVAGNFVNIAATRSAIKWWMQAA